MLLQAASRIGLPPKMVNVLRSLYTNTKFQVEIDGKVSPWFIQETGIRQGCPLSPYLFLIVMTVMFSDIHDGDQQNLLKHRIMGTNYDEVLYADDTICVSTDTRAMNKFLASIEEEGAKYGMRLNKGKCEMLNVGRTSNVHFRDGEKLKSKIDVSVSWMYVEPRWRAQEGSEPANCAVYGYSNQIANVLEAQRLPN